MNRKQMLERLRKGEDPLDLSIEKWVDIANGTGTDDGAENCALCETYRCANCPIRLKTGSSYCRNTPIDSHSEDLKEIGKAEVEFLQGLRTELGQKRVTGK